MTETTNTGSQFDTLAREIINRFMLFLNSHPGVKIRTKSDWALNPMLGIQVPDDFRVGLAGFIEKNVNPVIVPPTDVFNDAPKETIVTFTTPEPVVAPVIATEQPAEKNGVMPDVDAIMLLMSEKSVTLQQAAIYFNVDAEELRKVIQSSNGRVIIKRGGHLGVPLE